MTLTVAEEVAALKGMTPKELLDKHIEVFGEESRSRNKAWLIKRIAWRIQANAEGDLSERARKRAMEIANDSDLRVRAPVERKQSESAGPTKTIKVEFDHDTRLPLPGTLLSREYKGETVLVKVLQDGFECRGEVYRSLTGVVKAVTGSHWNGYHFFGLKKRGRSA